MGVSLKVVVLRYKGDDIWCYVFIFGNALEFSKDQNCAVLLGLSLFFPFGGCFHAESKGNRPFWGMP